MSFDRKYGNFEKSKRFTVEIMNYFPKIELPSWKSTKEFIWNHRYKLIGAGVAGTAVVAWYTDIFGITTTKDRHLIDNVDNLPNELNSSSNKKKKNRKVMNPGLRSRLLLRVRKHFDVAVNDFLPTLRMKINEVVDISTAIKQIKELRASGNGVDSILSEEQLWDEIKITSFSIMLVTTYMMSLVCVLLRVQFHILARSAPLPTKTKYDNDNNNINNTNNRNNTNINNNNNENRHNNDLLNEQDFKELIDSTYHHLFEQGLQHCAELIRTAVTKELHTWIVRDRVSVHWNDFNEVLMRVRRHVDSDLKTFVATVALPNNNDSSFNKKNEKEEEKKSVQKRNINKSTTTSSNNINNTNNDDKACSLILSQTWDIVESPMFCAVLAEAVTISFKYSMDEMQKHAFTPDGEGLSSNVAVPTHTPPLASLLPALKNVSSKVLPSAGVSACVRDIAGGPYLDALCTAVFDSPLEDGSISVLDDDMMTDHGGSILNGFSGMGRHS